MMRSHLVRTLAVLTAVALIAPACGRDEQATTPDERPVETVEQQRMQPLTVTGCLGAGDAAGMFVLTAAQTAGAAETATYHLTGAEGVDLQPHIGRRVEVSGIVRSEADLASRSRPDEAERARGTSGTPTVQTKTELQIRRLEVSQVRPTGEDCPK